MGMYEVLELIRFEKIITSHVVSEKAGISFCAASMNLQRLVKVGVLDRFEKVDNVHGRYCFYVFTPEGLELYDKLYGVGN